MRGGRSLERHVDHVQPHALEQDRSPDVLQRARAGTVLDDRSLAEPLTQLLRDMTREDIGAAPRTDRHDQANRARRVLLRQGGDAGQADQDAAGMTQERAHPAWNSTPRLSVSSRLA